MHQRPTPEPVATRKQDSSMTPAWTALQKAAAILDGAPALPNVTVTTNVFRDSDNISIMVDQDAPLEQRCAAVDWFAEKFGTEAGVNELEFTDSGCAVYQTETRFGANRPLYVRAWTVAAKAAL